MSPCGLCAPACITREAEPDPAEALRKHLEQGRGGPGGVTAVWRHGTGGGPGAERAGAGGLNVGRGSGSPQALTHCDQPFLTWTQVLCMHVGSALLNCGQLKGKGWVFRGITRVAAVGRGSEGREEACGGGVLCDLFGWWEGVRAHLGGGISWASH